MAVYCQSQESDAWVLLEAPTTGSSFRFQPFRHCINPPRARSDKKFLSCVERVRILGEATRGFSSGQNYLAQKSAKGGKRRKRIEPAALCVNSFNTCYHGITRRLLSSRKASCFIKQSITTEIIP